MLSILEIRFILSSCLSYADSLVRVIMAWIRIQGIEGLVYEPEEPLPCQR